MKSKLDAFTHEIVKSNSALSNYLTRLVDEQPYTPRSWLYENLSTDEVLQSWVSILERLDTGSAFEKKVFQFDLAQQAKWGPQGGHPHEREAIKIVEPSFEKGSPCPGLSSNTWKDAVRLHTVHKNLRPRALEQVVDDMRSRDVLESNSGLPDFARRKAVDVKSRALDDARSGKWEEYAAVLLYRRYNNKLRNVWMFPMSTNLVEGQFTQVLINHLTVYGDDFYTPWRGFEYVKKAIHNRYAEHRFLTALDFSATDEHFRIEQALSIMPFVTGFFQPSFSLHIEKSILHMLRIPLVISLTSWLTGEHGVSSGSGWTNLIETLFDRIFTEWIGWPDSMAIGDDILLSSGLYSEDTSELLEKYAEEVGMIVNKDKVTNERDSVKFLQRLFQRGYVDQSGVTRGVYPTIRALKSSVFPERFHNPKDWSSDMFCARQFMILENTVDHPLFDEFVRFVVKGQKDLIPFAKQSRADLNRITGMSRLVPGLNPTYNQEKRDQSLAAFKSIEIAATL